jgi:hypothetical protein
LPFCNPVFLFPKEILHLDISSQTLSENGEPPVVLVGIDGHYRDSPGDHRLQGIYAGLGHSGLRKPIRMSEFARDQPASRKIYRLESPYPYSGIDRGIVMIDASSAESREKSDADVLRRRRRLVGDEADSRVGSSDPLYSHPASCVREPPSFWTLSHLTVWIIRHNYNFPRSTTEL